MDVLERITELRKERHWTKYQLAEKSGLTQSTISSWYRKDMLPSIPSLTKICDAFNMTLAQFFLDESNSAVPLNEQQQQLLKYCSKLSPEQFEALLSFFEKL